MRSSLLTVALSLVIAACSKDPKEPGYWSHELKKAKTPEDRVRVLEQLRASNHLHPSFVPVLSESLREEKDPVVTVAYAKSLLGLKHASSVQWILAGLVATKDSATRAELAAGLREIQDPKVVQALSSAARNSDPQVASEAVDALTLLWPKEAISDLRQLASDETTPPIVTKRCIEALGNLGDPSAVPELIKLLVKDRQGRFLTPESAFALFQLGKPSTEALLPIAAKDAKEMFDWARTHNVMEPNLLGPVAEVLGDLGDERAVAPLIQLLAYEHPDEDFRLLVRRRAADGLGRLRAKAAVQPLMGMLDESEIGGRDQYVRALGQIGDRAALAGLAKAATVGEWNVREAAIVGLTVLGDERELPALKTMLQHEEQLVRKTCRENPSFDRCDKPDRVVSEFLDSIRTHGRRLEAAKACKKSVPCWLQKLDGSDAVARHRAAIELGQLGSSEAVDKLVEHLTDAEAQVQFTSLQSLHWLIDGNPEARERARTHLATFERLLIDWHNKVPFARMTAPLRRLAHKLRHTAS